MSQTGLLRSWKGVTEISKATALSTMVALGAASLPSNYAKAGGNIGLVAPAVPGAVPTMEVKNCLPIRDRERRNLCITGASRSAADCNRIEGDETLKGHCKLNFSQRASLSQQEAPFPEHCLPGVDPNQSVPYLQAKRLSKGGFAMLHYGDGIKDAELQAEALVRDGYPVIAAGGGPEGLIRIMVNGKSLDRKYTQEEMDDGRLAGNLTEGYDFATLERGYFSRPSCDNDGPQIAGF